MGCIFLWPCDLWQVHCFRDAFSKGPLSPLNNYWCLQNSNFEWPSGGMSSVARFVSRSLKGHFSCTLSVRLFWYHCGGSCCGEMTQVRSNYGEEHALAFLWTMPDHFPDLVQLVAVHAPDPAKLGRNEARMGSCWCCVGERVWGGLGSSGFRLFCFSLWKNLKK